MSVIDDDSALLKIFRLELHMNIDLIEAAKKQIFCGRTKLDEHSLKSDIWFGLHDAIRLLYCTLTYFMNKLFKRVHEEIRMMSYLPCEVKVQFESHRQSQVICK